MCVCVCVCDFVYFYVHLFRFSHCLWVGTSTLAGAVVFLDKCARNLRDFTQCEVTEVLAALTTHPARYVSSSREKLKLFLIIYLS